MALDALKERVRTRLILPAELQFVQSDDATWHDVYDVGDGNLNDVIQITSKSDPSILKSVVLKHAPPYIKFLGPEYLLSTSRNNIEYASLVKFDEICPGLVPKPYFCDEEEHILLMENLQGFTSYRMSIIGGNLGDQAVMDVAEFTLQLHTFTHRRKMATDEFTAMIEQFRNDAMVEFIDQYFFKRPWIRGDPTNKASEEVMAHASLVYDDQILLGHVEDLRQKFLTQKDCLLHGDLHTGSAMTDGEHAKVIDPEFAFVGPAAFDVGMLIANYIFHYYAHLNHPLENSVNFHERIKLAFQRTVEHYFKGMASSLDQIELGTLIRDTAAYTGCELLRRMLGTSLVVDLLNRPESQKTCIKLGVGAVRRHEGVKTYQDLIRLLEME